jgi:opacity protein-like surface antigen
MRIFIWTIGIGVTLAASSLATSAAAEEGQGEHRFGSPGFIVSADRLLPLVSYQSTELSQNGNSDTQSRLSIALMNNGPPEVFSTFYNLPRLAFDWVPIQNLTIGGAAWLYVDLQATDTKSGSSSTDQAKLTYWGIAPRVGYIVPMGDKLSFWPRAGIEYNNVSSSDGSESITQFAVDLEAMLVISPWNHFGFTVGPTADIPITGKQTVANSGQVDLSMLQVGLSAGMLGHF